MCSRIMKIAMGLLVFALAHTAWATEYNVTLAAQANTDPNYFDVFGNPPGTSFLVTVTFTVDSANVTTVPAGGIFATEVQLISIANLTNLSVDAGAQFSAENLVEQTAGGYNFNILLVGNLANTVSSVYLFVENLNLGKVETANLDCNTTCQVSNLGSVADYTTGGQGDVSTLQISIQSTEVPVSEQITELATLVVSLNLQQNISNSLDAKLSNVTAAFD